MSKRIGMSLVFIISAPSGSGKSTLVNEIKRLVDRLDFSVSYTTRPPAAAKKTAASTTTPAAMSSSA